MSKNYRVKAVEYDYTTEYAVYETQTEQEIKVYPASYYVESIELTNRLNKGAGFDGFTPSFFLNDAKVKFKS